MGGGKEGVGEGVLGALGVDYWGKGVRGEERVLVIKRVLMMVG